MEKTDRVVESDVLVIGGGLAGCWAALRAAELGARVTLVDKAQVSRSGASVFAAGVILAPEEGDDLDAWLREIVENGEYLNDQDWVKVFLEDQVKRIKDLIAFGVPFEKEGDANLGRILGRGHQVTRIAMFHGKKMMEAMRKKVGSIKNVTLVERTVITDLLVKSDHEKRVIGAIGFQARSGEPVAFLSPAVVLAAGFATPRFGAGMVDNLGGGGIAMASRAGAKLTNLEFCMNSNITIWERKYICSGINMLQGAGAKFLNSKGQRFMLQYDPVLIERASLSTLARAFAKESLEGRGPIQVDMRHFSRETFERFERVIPKLMRVFKDGGIDPGKVPVECTPNVRVPGNVDCRGIRVDLNCRSSLPGLLAAGACSCNLVHGTYSVGGVNLAYCCVSGYRAGEEAARIGRAGTVGTIPRKEIDQKVSLARAVMQREGETPDDVMLAYRRLVLPAEYSLFPNETRMQFILNKLEELDGIKLRVNDTHEFVKALELKDVILCAKLKFQASLIRKESRGDLYREDFPFRDDISWLKWINIQHTDEGDVVDVEEVPLDRYPVQPAERRQIPYPVQFHFS